METQEPPQAQDDNNVLKPKRKQTLTDEQRAAKAAHMRKISLARIEKARLASEEKLNAVEEKIVERLAKVEDKKQQVRKIKEEKSLGEPTPVPTPTPKKKKAKQIVYDSSSSDQEDEDDSEEEEVVYVAKKKRQTIVKAKKEKAVSDSKAAIEPVVPKTIIKFL